MGLNVKFYFVVYTTSNISKTTWAETDFREVINDHGCHYYHATQAVHFGAALAEQPDVTPAALLHEAQAQVSPPALLHVAQELAALPLVRGLPVPELVAQEQAELWVLVRRVAPRSHEALVLALP